MVVGAGVVAIGIIAGVVGCGGVTCVVGVVVGVIVVVGGVIGVDVTFLKFSRREEKTGRVYIQYTQSVMT